MSFYGTSSQRVKLMDGSWMEVMSPPIFYFILFCSCSSWTKRRQIQFFPCEGPLAFKLSHPVVSLQHMEISMPDHSAHQVVGLQSVFKSDPWEHQNSQSRAQPYKTILICSSDPVPCLPIYYISTMACPSINGTLSSLRETILCHLPVHSKKRWWWWWW